MTGRFATNKAGYATMRKHVAGYRDRTWAVEGSNGAGRPLGSVCWPMARTSWTSRRSSARGPRLFDTGHNRRTDARTRMPWRWSLSVLLA